MIEIAVELNLYKQLLLLLRLSKIVIQCNPNDSDFEMIPYLNKQSRVILKNKVNLLI